MTAREALRNARGQFSVTEVILAMAIIGCLSLALISMLSANPYGYMPDMDTVKTVLGIAAIIIFGAALGGYAYFLRRRTAARQKQLQK
ncbi:hypothetical protein [Arthrobacter caoxuetaonis]|uniref:Uncharacterized protein n=1 Tax=Arthrobacter caoxuetaonis TaxID=2886935 RepID=A0A9X1SE76_9MICC|nr:hypothetical protein [Arthrobacter caoxuetaonis]MCC3299366.1 hypothetical protein [Arthrobacter caoxuetaonis]USQ59141.1 hypothetical protein NF551_18720 [Arthrobacter caoxuetaonis]